MKSTFINKILVIGIITLLTGCTFIQNYFETRKKSLEFFEILLEEDYARCVSLMPVDYYEGISLDSTRMQLQTLKINIDKLFGRNLKATFLSTLTTKTYKTIGKNKLGPTKIEEFGVVQLKNDSCYGNFQVKFDKKSGKIENVELMFIKPVPDNSNLYVFGTLGLLVLVFNLFTIWKLIKSSLTKKWMWILIIIVLNFPVIVFSYARGLFIQWIGIMPFLGIGFSFSDMDSMSVMCGIPIGALLVWYKIANIPSQEIEEDNEDEASKELTTA